MKRLTDNQILHRQYLQSDVWRAKRIEALAHYGCICNRCKEHGTDVHHKTYERWGGSELMEDLEVLCRGCHEAHHSAERCSRTRKHSSQRSINRRAIFRLLSFSQREILKKKYQMNNSTLAFHLSQSAGSEATDEALKFLGIRHAYGGFRDKPPDVSRGKTNVEKMMDEMIRLGFNRSDVLMLRKVELENNLRRIQSGIPYDKIKVRRAPVVALSDPTKRASQS